MALPKKVRAPCLEGAAKCAEPRWAVLELRGLQEESEPNTAREWKGKMGMGWDGMGNLPWEPQPPG